MNQFKEGDVLVRDSGDSDNLGLYMIKDVSNETIEMITLDYETREYAIGHTHVSSIEYLNLYQKIGEITV